MTIGTNQRALLAELADVLIPADGNMPSASQADVAGRCLDAVLTARPDLSDGLLRLLSKVTSASTPEEVVNRLRQDDPASFSTLAEIVSNAYFMNPDVRESIGYAGQEPLMMDPRPDYMEDGLLTSVIRRGRIYRATPE